MPTAASAVSEDAGVVAASIFESVVSVSGAKPKEPGRHPTQNQMGV